MFVLKGCPRCGGDLFAGIDDDYTCMQCGKDIAANTVSVNRKGAGTERRVPAQAGAAR